MRRAPEATPRMRPELRPKKLTRRSASPSEKVFKMMASVSLAGMSCRRADAFTNDFQSHVRFVRTRRVKLITTHARATQCLHGVWRKNSPHSTDALFWRKNGALRILLTTRPGPLHIIGRWPCLNSLCILPLFRYSAPLLYVQTTFRHFGHRRKCHGHRSAASSVPCSRLQDGTS